MNRSPSINKLSPPRLPEIYPRHRLYVDLDNAFKRPVVWVHGPGGSGKSTLVADYLKRCKYASIWYQIDSGDSDIATFFYYLGLAVQKTVPDTNTLPLFTQEYHADITVFARRYFESLFSRLGPPFVLVLDDYHEISADSSLNEIINIAANELPRGITIVVISRQPPSRNLARLGSRRMVSQVGWDKLRLDLEELRGVVQLYDKAEALEAVLELIHTKVQGWLAGLILFLEQRDKSDYEGWLGGTAPQQDIFNYFADELFEKTSQGLQDFFLQTSLLPTVVPHLAEALTQNPHSADILNDLYRSHLFTEKLQESEDIYRFHPLFREYLLDKLETSYTSRRLSALKRTAATVLLEAGRTDEAASLCVGAKEWELLEGIVLKNAQEILEKGRTQTLQAWLEHIPVPRLEQSPYLLLWMGICKMSSGFTLARELFEKAHALFELQDDAVGLYLSWSGVIDSIVYEWANYSRLDIWLKKLDCVMEKHPNFPSKEIEGRVAGSMFGALMFHMPQHKDIDVWANRLLHLIQENNHPAYRIMVGNQLALYHLWWSGDHIKLSIVMELLQPPDNEDALPALPAIIWTGLKGLQQWALGYSENAQKLFVEGLNRANASGVHVWDFMLYFLGVVAYLGEGEHKTGKIYLDELVAKIDRSQSLNLAHYHYVAAWQASLVGLPEKSLQHAQEAVHASKHLGGPFSEAAVTAAMAQALHLNGRCLEAFQAIDRAIQITKDIKTPLLLFRNLMVKAFFYLDSNEEIACVETLNSALELGKKYQFMNFSWWQGNIMTRLCLKAMEVGIEPDYVSTLIIRRNLMPDQPPLHVENWPWRFKIFTLGRFELLKDGRQLVFSGKVQKKPLEMLKLLVALGGREEREGQIADLLWPESVGDAAKNTFKVTLHRLRELLGGDNVLPTKDGCLSLDSRYIWVDSWAFARIAGKMLKTRESNTPDNRQELERLLDVYKGPFLIQDDDKSWTIAYRKKIHDHFVTAVITLGNLYAQRGEYQQAIASYQRGLEIDHISEKIYQGLIQNYLNAGLKAEAANTYLHYKKILAIEFCIDPSDNIVKLYNSIANSQSA